MITFDKCKCFKGNIKVPADKSITHRAVIMGSMADGVTVVRNPLISRDTLATMNIMQQLGVNIVNERSRLLIHSEGVKNFKEPYDVLNCDNSGTTARLVMGMLAPNNFYSVLTGDASLLRRPMARVIEPLSKLGAVIKAKNNNNLLPATIIPGNMKAGEITAETNSYQVHEGKWALLKTKVIHPLFNRYARNTKPFHADAALCDGCGWCAVHCPAKTIQLVDGLPVWNQSCYQCLKCLNGCPKKAINYGKHTMNRKRYRMERYVKSSAK